VIAEDALVIGLGGNVGDEAAIIERFQRAREAIGLFGDVESAGLYRTSPLGPSQAMFLNSAVRVRARDATAMQIIETLLEIERLLGRNRQVEARWGPRPIDLDVLVWGSRIARWEGPPALEVPHPRLIERRFALQPLIDLLGEDIVVPGTAVSARSLERRLTGQVIEELARAW
jgi:2-amino-4-hydroxy-6-hydroxymethyldihydropteridine diphosphokinase